MFLNGRHFDDERDEVLLVGQILNGVDEDSAERSRQPTSQRAGVDVDPDDGRQTQHCPHDP